MAKGENIPDDHHVVRLVKKTLMGRDDNGEVIVDEEGHPKAIFPAAFELREDEESLSVTWLERFGENFKVSLRKSVEAHRNSLESKRLPSKCSFVIGNIAVLKDAGENRGLKLRVLHDPVDGNEGHSEIRRMPRDLSLIHMDLASKVFSRRYLASAVLAEGWLAL